MAQIFLSIGDRRFHASVRDQDAAEHGISIPVASICRLFLPFREWIITMLDERFARLRTHRNNIARYRGLLKTSLTDLERQFIERRLSEEQSEFEMLSADKDRHIARPDNADRNPLAGNESITNLQS
jgi:hypothetical protein